MCLSWGFTEPRTFIFVLGPGGIFFSHSYSLGRMRLLKAALEGTYWECEPSLVMTPSLSISICLNVLTFCRISSSVYLTMATKTQWLVEACTSLPAPTGQQRWQPSSIQFRPLFFFSTKANVFIILTLIQRHRLADTRDVKPFTVS